MRKFTPDQARAATQKGLSKIQKINLMNIYEGIREASHRGETEWKYVGAYDVDLFEIITGEGYTVIFTKGRAEDNDMLISWSLQNPGDIAPPDSFAQDDF